MAEHASRFPASLDPLIAEAKGRRRKRRFLIAMLLVLGVGLGAAFALSFSPNGAGGPSSGDPGWLSNQVSQAQHTFGRAYIASATVQGRVLTVKLSAAGGAANEAGGFEAHALGYAVADRMRAQGKKPVTSVYVVGPGGRVAGDGYAYPGTRLGRDASPRLRSGTCERASKHLPASLRVGSDRTLPYVGGVCILRVQTSAQTSAGVGTAFTKASMALGDALPSWSDPPSLIEIDDATGTPQVIKTWFPGLGLGFVGSGSDYQRPGINVIGHA
jgi:hypothetical protein